MGGQEHLLGVKRLLGDREASIMEVLWDREDVSVREIQKALSAESELAYTTVMTTTDRLWKKGLLERRKSGNAYLYTPKESRESFIASCLGRLLESFMPDMSAAALSRFVDSLAERQPELLEELEQKLAQRRSSP